MMKPFKIMLTEACFLRPQRALRQARCLIKPIHYIHILQRLACSAFYQVILYSKYNGRGTALWLKNG